MRGAQQPAVAATPERRGARVERRCPVRRIALQRVEVYVRTGDRAALTENYDMMKRWTEAYAREAKDFIVDRAGYGDW